MYAVRYALSATGVTSAAYAGPVVAKIPHGIEHSISPTSRTGVLGAKKTMKTKPDSATIPPMITFRCPNLAVSQPFSNAPMMVPIAPVTFSAFCQEAEIWYPDSSL